MTKSQKSSKLLANSALPEAQKVPGLHTRRAFLGSTATAVAGSAVLGAGGVAVPHRARAQTAAPVIQMP